MPKIPVTETSVGFQPAMMPTISGESYAAPGKAMQGLGNALGGFGEAFAAEDEFNDNLKIVQFKEAQEQQQIKDQNEYDRPDPNGYALDKYGAYTKARDSLIPTLKSPKVQQRARLMLESHGSDLYQRNMRFEYNKRDNKLYDDTSATITGMFGGAQLNNPDTVFDEVQKTVAGANLMIDKIPGANDERRRKLQAETAAYAIKKMHDVYSGADRLEDFAVARDRFLKEWSMREQNAPVGAGQQPSGNVRIEPTSGGHAFVTAGSGARLRVSATHADRFAGVIRDLEAAGVTINANESGGYADRNIEGTNVKSRHAFGGAIDINWNQNPRGGMGQITKQLPPERIREIARANGLKWGGDWKNPDPMHFEVDRSINYKAPPVSQRGITAFAGMTQPAATPKVTAYSPQASGSSLVNMEGTYAAAKPGPDGQAVVRTLDDVQSGRSKYITIAGDPSQYGKTYVIPEITYIDARGKEQKLTNVKAVVHDTGSAFKGAGDKKFDIPVARDLTDAQMNRQPFLKGGVQFIPADAGGASAASPTEATGEKTRVALAGMTNEQKAAKLDELIKGGHTSFVHQIGSDGADIIIARKTGQIGWHRNMPPKAGGPGDIADPAFAGPEWATEQVKGLKELAARPANTVPGARQTVAQAPGSAPPVVPGARPSVQKEIAEHLLKHSEQYDKELEVSRGRWVKGVAERIKTIQDNATKGIIRDSDANDLEKLIAMKPALAASAGLADAGSQIRQYIDEMAVLRLYPPTQQAEVIRRMEENIRTAPASVTPEQLAMAQKRLEHIKGLYGHTVEEMKKDPLSWANQVGVQRLEPLKLTDPESVQKRIAAAKAVGDHYGRPDDVKFLTVQERDELSSIMRTGGKRMQEALKLVYAGFGKDALKVVGEFSKEAPEAAMVGWMMTAGHDQRLVDDLAAGIERQQKRALGEKMLVPVKPTDERKLYIETVGTALRERPASEASAIQATNAIYEVQAQRNGWAEAKPDEWKRILKEIIGESKDGQGNVFGGVYQSRWSNRGLPITVPTNMRQDAVFQALDALYAVDELKDNRTMFAPGGTGSKDAVLRGGVRMPQMQDKDPKETLPSRFLLGAFGEGPTTGSGTPLSIGALRRATLVTIGDGKYWMAMGDVAGGDPQWVQNGLGGGRYVLDLKALEPMIRARRPDLYKGYVDPTWGKPPPGQPAPAQQPAAAPWYQSTPAPNIPHANRNP